MKKVIILAVLFLASCEKENKEVETKNCNCDRIASVLKYTLIGGTHYANIVTVNDCSNLNKNEYYQSSTSIYSKKVGDCY